MAHDLGLYQGGAAILKVMGTKHDSHSQAERVRKMYTPTFPNVAI